MPLKRIARKLMQIVALFLGGNIRIAIGTVLEWLWSDTYAMGLERNLRSPFTPDLIIPELRIREMREDDFGVLFHSPNVVGGETRTLLSFEGFYRQGIGLRYVAINEDGIPCYMASLITAKDNRSQQKYFRGYLPELEAGEALIENLYTVIDFRRQGIHGYATHLICEEARKMGLKSVFIYIGCGNVGSLKGARRAGFQARSMRLASWRFFRRTVKFTPIEELNDPSGICEEALITFGRAPQ